MLARASNNSVGLVHDVLAVRAIPSFEKYLALIVFRSCTAQFASIALGVRKGHPVVFVLNLIVFFAPHLSPRLSIAERYDELAANMWCVKKAPMKGGVTGR